MNRTKVLNEARQIVENGWCKFAGAKDSLRNTVPVESETATYYCVLGALDRACAKVYADDETRQIAFLDAMEFFRIANNLENVIHWNDDWDRDLHDVIEAFDVAIHKSHWDATCYRHQKREALPV